MSTLVNSAQTRHPSGMEPLPRAESTNPFSLGTSSVDKEEAREIPVHNLKAKFFFDRPAEDLIPARYLQMAQDTRELLISPSSTSTNEYKESIN
jgi:hypothetical protein